ncbi:MAG: NB-ARC domain-containing protein [Anaerolineae bacterium]
MHNQSNNNLLQVIRQELKNYHVFDEEPGAEVNSFRVLKNQLETQSQPNAPFAKRLAFNTVLHQVLDETSKENKDLATLLKKRFLDKETIPEVSEHFHISQATVSRWTDRAIEIATAKFNEIEQEANESWYNRLTARLPARNYDRLVGVDTLRDRLVTKIVDPEGPGIIALSGIGGIGKSSLADYVVRKALRSGLFHEVAWIGFRPEHEKWLLVKGQTQEQFVSLLAHAVVPGAGPLSLDRQVERIADRLKSVAHLIVIDNLEEQQETDSIIQYLNGIENPSRFIVTTRVQPARTTCHVTNLTELARDDSLNMMQYYLESTGQTQIGEVDEETLEKIFYIVGGNPLALKITAGLMQWMPLEKILADLEKGRGDAAVIYQTIFRHTWNTLSAESQLLLQSMAMSGAVEGVSASKMQETSGLAVETFWNTVDELLLRSMLEVRGPLNNRRYGIHRLTEAFIDMEIGTG